VVPGRDDVRACVEELRRELRRQADAVGRVLAVDDAEVDLALVAQALELLFDRAAAGGAEDVREEEEPDG